MSWGLTGDAAAKRAMKKYVHCEKCQHFRPREKKKGDLLQYGDCAAQELSIFCSGIGRICRYFKRKI